MNLQELNELLVACSLTDMEAKAVHKKVLDLIEKSYDKGFLAGVKAINELNEIAHEEIVVKGLAEHQKSAQKNA